MAGKILISLLLEAYYSNLSAHTNHIASSECPVEALLCSVNSVFDSSMNHIASSECPFEVEVACKNLDSDL